MFVDKRPVCWEVYEALKRPRHHARMGVSEADLRRFAQKVKPMPSGCWEWIGNRNKKGYGLIYFFSKFPILAHRLAYELMKGDIPDGLILDHLRI